MGSDCRIADWNNEDADGVANKARIMVAPELCPAIVIFEGLPPKLGSTVCRKFIAVMTSWTARFMLPLGAIKPNYAQL